MPTQQTVDTGETPSKPTTNESTPTADLTPAPTPAPTRVTTDADPSGQATLVEGIHWQPSSNNLLRVTVTLNGTLSRERVRHERLNEPPRHLFRLIGIEQEFKPFTLRTESAQAPTVRVGFHEDRDPHELHIVFDLG
ncbi:MAG: hypothetical protein GY906_15535, partial [bacterium]|nr:hypothetical protein [bacterium]